MADNNITSEIKGNKLILTIDISATAKLEAPLSKTGKTKLLATTGGFKEYGNVKVSLNATIPLQD